MVANFEYFATNFIEFSILLEEYEIIKYGRGGILFLLYNYRVSGLSCPEAGGCKSAIL